jgi:hypothetical protein
MPIDHEDPNDYTNYAEHEYEDENPVQQREILVASGANSAGDEPVDIEEDWDYNKERKHHVDEVFGVTLE